MFFYTYGPDDVHDMRVIQLATPYTDQHSFPAIVPDKYKKALAGATDTERVVRSEDGSIEFDFRERALQSLAARNPCACAVVFNHISENVRDNLLGKSRHRLKDTALSKREKGILGRCVSNHDVIETNKRGSMHNHGLFQGSFSPETLAHLAEYPKLRELALKGPDTQLKAELPI